MKKLNNINSGGVKSGKIKKMSNRVDKYSDIDYKKDKFEGKLPLVEIVIMIFGLLVIWVVVK